MKEYKEHEDTTRLWCLATMNLVDTDTLGKILERFIALRDDDPDGTLQRLCGVSWAYGEVKP